jgi:aldehyde:ferredoxin oxidoreductase
MQNLGIIQDSLGICRFTGFAFSTDPWARMVSGITGMNFSTSRLEEIANRVSAVERLFNIKAGITAEADRLPMRFQAESITVAEEEKKVPPDSIAKMLAGYYKIRGWDKEGKPEGIS